MSALVGFGAATAWGRGPEAALTGLLQGRRALSALTRWDPSGFPFSEAGQVPGFDPRKQLPDRKAVKLMSREAQLGVFAAVQAGRFAAPERCGVFAAAGYEVASLDDNEPMLAASSPRGVLDLAALFGPGRDATNPLAPLKVLPNMALFHVASTLDARGPHLSLGSSPAAGIAALGEACDPSQPMDEAIVLGTDDTIDVFRAQMLVEAGVPWPPGEAGVALRVARDGELRVLDWALGQAPMPGFDPRGDYGLRAPRPLLAADVDLALVDGPAPEVPPGVTCLQSRPLIGWTGAAAGLIDVMLAALLVRDGHAKRVLVSACGLAGDRAVAVIGRAR